MPFVLAMRWNARDPQRKTGRADVTFWPHLATAPMIVHPTFALLSLPAAGSLTYSLAFTALVIGSGLLPLSILWHRAPGSSF